MLMNFRSRTRFACLVPILASVSLLTTKAHAAAEPALAMSWNQEMGPAVRARAAEVLSGAGDFFHSNDQALSAASPTGQAFWHLEMTFYSLLFMAVGVFVASAIRRWGRQHFIHLFNDQPEERSEKIGYLLVSGVMKSVGVVAFALTALGLSMMFDSGVAAARHTHFIQIAGVSVVWLISIIIGSMLAHGVPSHRLLPLDDETVGLIHRHTTRAFGVTTFILGTCLWMEAMGLNEDAHLLSLILGLLTGAVLFSILAFFIRRPIAALFLGGRPRETNPLLLRLLAQTWHVWASLYFLGSWAIVSSRLLLDLPGAMPLVMAPSMALFVAIVLYAVLLLVIDKLDQMWGLSPQVDETPETESPEANETGSEARVEAEVEVASSEKFPKISLPPVRSLKDLMENAAVLISFMVAFAIMMRFWGVDVTSDEHGLIKLGDFLIVLFLSYLGYQAIKISVDQKIAEEGVAVEPEPGDEGGGAGASRLATLLPLARNFMLITVVVMSSMILLSQLGVDIAPLFAGAGVVGLAIGFGSQALIRDIFSGAFFLVDDAFRKGEYVDCGEVKGTVEKISIRSMQLRHHLGPLHTIPFGEIKRLTNFSRDWAMMKLTLRVTYDTDVEKVRKLIKVLGQELMEHPEVGDKFLQPLKSQGVLSMEDSAMILRVKFMAKPGEQFVIRKLVYAKIRELFEREGIKFAHRQVTVRVANDDDDNPRTLSKTEQRAIAGAAVPGPDEQPA
jgi:moderate conductance mechanosensitive channel